jgi:hypothetical protein
MTSTTKRDLTTILSLAILLLTVSGASADQAPADDGLDGWFLGIGAGFGDGFTTWEDGDRSVTEEGEFGAMGALRLGYAINSRWALSLEGYGHGVRGHDDLDDGDDDLGIGAGFIVGTWHPTGGGFFVRLGVGAGGGEFVHPDTREKVELEGELAGLFGLGYDWRVGEKTALGVAFDGIALHADGATGYDSDSVGAGTFSIQFTWHP